MTTTTFFRILCITLIVSLSTLSVRSEEAVSVISTDVYVEQLGPYSFFTTDEDEWTWRNLLIGPVELIAAPCAPLFGAVMGGAVGTIAPITIMRSDWHALLIPYTAPAGLAAGTVFGAAVTPILAIEGVFNTLTFGAFADHPFDWFRGPRVYEYTEETLTVDE